MGVVVAEHVFVPDEQAYEGSTGTTKEGYLHRSTYAEGCKMKIKHLLHESDVGKLHLIHKQSLAIVEGDPKYKGMKVRIIVVENPVDKKD